MKTVLVTGACGIVGTALWQTLTQAGYNVIGVDMANELPFENAKVDFRGGIDLSNEAAVIGLAETLKQEGYALNGLVNIAGGFVWEEALSGDSSTWTRMFQINLMTALNACKAMAPKFARVSEDWPGIEFHEIRHRSNGQATSWGS